MDELSVNVMRDKRVRPARSRNVREVVGEIAKSTATNNDDEAESGDSDTGARVKVVQKYDQTDYRCNGKSEKSDADCHHGESVDHAKESITRTRIPRPKPKKKPAAVARSTSRSVLPPRIAA